MRDFGVLSDTHLVELFTNYYELTVKTKTE